MDKLKQQVSFVEMLAKNLLDSFANYTAWNWRDKNCGKTALKRKITTLRQELLNLERMLDNG